MHASELWDKGWLQKLDDIFIIKMFMPFPLKENNAFLAESDTGWVIIDTGINSEQNRAIFTAALDAIGISWQDISAIYLTHYHHDHSGLAGWLQQKTNAPVYLPHPDLITWQTYIDTDQYFEKAREACLLAAWPLDLVRELADNIKRIKPMLEPLPVFTPIYPGYEISLANHKYTAIAVPGHTDGHLVFHSPESKILFSGDNVVAHTILHLTDWPQNIIDSPCDLHLAALKYLQTLPINTVIPGHGRIFSNLNPQIDRITEHHNRRKALTFDALQEPATAWQLAESIFNPNPYIHIRRLVLAETLAYLQSLVNQGLVTCNLIKASHIYSRTDN